MHAALNTCVPWPLSLPAQQELLKELELCKRRLHEESRARREAEERVLEVQPRSRGSCLYLYKSSSQEVLWGLTIAKFAKFGTC